MASRLPLTLITGFLGSGKTTLINAILRNPAFAGTLVIVNEFGEVGLDHLLMDSAQDQVLLLESGCLCCAASGSLRDTLIDIFARRAAGSIQPFDRIFVETSGLAHPGPLVATLIGDSALRPRCFLDQVLTVVDAVNGVATLQQYTEANYQVAFADQLVLTKGAAQTEADSQLLRAHLHELNPHALTRHWAPGLPADVLFDVGPRSNALSDAPEAWLMQLAQVQRRLEPAAGIPSLFTRGHEVARPDAGHGSAYQRVGTYVMHFGKTSMSWAAYAAWNQAVSARWGRRLVRCKGILRIDDGQSWVVQGVQGYFAPPVRLDDKRHEEGDSFLVCIVDGIAPEDLMAISADVPDFPVSSFSPPKRSDQNYG